jgi:hypothetical protein
VIVVVRLYVEPAPSRAPTAKMMMNAASNLGASLVAGFGFSGVADGILEAAVTEEAQNGQNLMLGCGSSFPQFAQ